MKTQKQIAVVPASGVEVILEGILTRLFFDFADPVPVGEETFPEDLKICESVDVDSRDYAHIVSAIITDHYSADEYQAILANYQVAKDPESEISAEKRAEYLSEYETFQAWRAHAKEIAHIAVSEIESM